MLCFALLLQDVEERIPWDAVKQATSRYSSRDAAMRRSESNVRPPCAQDDSQIDWALVRPEWLSMLTPGEADCAAVSQATALGKNFLKFGVAGSQVTEPSS